MNCKQMRRLPLLAAFLLAACGGGSNDDGSTTPTTVTLSGRITFDRVPFKIQLGAGLDFAAVVESPARGVVVDAIDSGTGTALATANTDTNGNYSMSVPTNRNVFVRAKTQMLATGIGATWNFRVLNNANGNALYVLDGQVFGTGAADVTRNLRATSGWNGSAYTTTRAAAPFAILDTAYRAKELLLTAQPTLAMPALDIYWSVSNRPAGPFCPALGNIISTAYQRSVSNGCTPSSVSPSGIYVQGDFANGSGDTDEFDQFVVAHEFGHYVEDMIGRTDSIGGSHGVGSRLDLRVALSEGWGNAFAAMTLNDPIYRDSIGANSDFNENIEAAADPNPGWFSESTVQQILWDVFDSANEAGDTMTLGFTPIYQTMVGPQRNTFALTGLHGFATGLKTLAPAAASSIDTLLTMSPRNITGTGDFAIGETNNGSEPSVLPVYIPISLNAATPTTVCSTSSFGYFNRLGNRKFLSLDLSVATTVTIVVTGQTQAGASAASDPDAVLWRQGLRAWIGNSDALSEERSGALQLQSGTYVLEVYDYAYADPNMTTTDRTPRCMRVSVTG